MTIEEAIKIHRCEILGKDVKRITVRRSHVFKDTVVALSKFEDSSNLRVMFVGDPCIDQGGPRREYFMLLLKEICNNNIILKGPPYSRMIKHSPAAFQVTTCLFFNKFLLEFDYKGPIYSDSSATKSS